MRAQDTRKGIWLMVATTFVFAMQDGLSRFLAGEYNVLMVVMIRYWFFAVFVIALAARAQGGLRAAVRTRHPFAQVLRGVLLAAEICVMVAGFRAAGAGREPCGVCLLSLAGGGPVRPGAGRKGGLAALDGDRHRLCRHAGDPAPRLYGVFARSAVPLLAARCSRLRAADALGQPRGQRGGQLLLDGGRGLRVHDGGGHLVLGTDAPRDWGWMGVLCITGALGHYLLIRAYEVAEASAVQPFAYLQLVFATALGITVFGETLEWNVALGGAIVVAAGLFTLWRARVRASAG
jgi:hypothetical protein